MISELSPNTQAVLLLTAPLFVGSPTSTADLLSPSEYNRLARCLREMQHQPADLVTSGESGLLRACRTVVEETRLQRLLGRGFLLSQVLERWRARAIWVVSRADSAYPQRLKVRLREDAPPVLYGCGDAQLLDRGGLAVVGSRHVNDDLIAYTMEAGRLAAKAGKTIVSGGARGVDRSAMRGALEEGGRVCGVLADSLEDAAMNREHRDSLMDGRLALISRYDPRAGFNVGNAMQRNKLIYALADVALVVNSDLNKGGTWTGAIEQLERLRLVPVFVRTAGAPSAGLEALRKHGALEWPEPDDVPAFNAIFEGLPIAGERELALPLSSDDSSVSPLVKEQPPVTSDKPAAALVKMSPNGAHACPEVQTDSAVALESPTRDSVRTVYGDGQALPPDESSPADDLIATARQVVLKLLTVPMTEAQVAASLDVSASQARAWLQRFVKEGKLDARNKPVRYVARAQASLLVNHEDDRETRRKGTRRR
jgi:DNA processing protein